jgi:hypothetical protein
MSGRITARSRIVSALFFAVCFGVSVWLQKQAGAFEGEFGGHPDEAAHYVTGLMVHDYLKSGFAEGPMTFAKKYYDHYPKVALGNWPPGFYVAQSAWSLIFSPQKTPILLFMAAVAATASLLIFLSLRKTAGTLLAAAGGLLFIALPLTQRHAAMIMTELPIAVWVFGALLALISFVEDEKRNSALLFGICAAAAILTKGSGLFLGLVPPLAILLTRKFHLLKRPALWMSALIVFVFCFPWTWKFRNEARAGWLEGDPSLTFTKKAVLFYPKELWLAFGFGLGLLLLIGLFTTWKSGSERGVAPRWAVATSALFSLLLFHSIVPVGFEDRHLVPILPVGILFVIAGVKQVSDWLPRAGMNPQLAPVAAILLAAAIFLLETFRVPPKGFAGFGAVAETLLKNPDNQRAVFLVCSDARGEGMFISEVAMRESRPGHTVQRASKLMASSSWSGSGYKPRFENEEAAAEFLHTNRADWIVVDTSIPPKYQRPHQQLLERALETHATWFKIEDRRPILRANERSDGLLVYRVMKN